MFQQPTDRGVSGFMIGDDLFFVLGDELPLSSPVRLPNAVYSIQKILLTDLILVFSRSNECRFIAYIGAQCRPLKIQVFVWPENPRLYQYLTSVA